MLDALGTLYVRGLEIDWNGFDAPYRRRRVALPSYAFERERCWLEQDEIHGFAERREGQAWT